MAKWKQLIEAREEMSLSQTEAAERLQVGLLTYQKWELGKAKPQPQNRRRLRELFPLLDRPRSEKQGSLTDTETSVQSHSKTAVDRAQAQGGHQFVPMSSTALVVSTPPVLLTVSNRPEETDQLSDLPGSMRDALWTPAFLDHLTCSEKRSAIRQVLKDYDSMNTTNKNYQITRREAIRSLARLPMITLGLSIPGTIVQTSRYGDALAHCAAALEGCWELWKDNNTGDIPLAFQGSGLLKDAVVE